MPRICRRSPTTRTRAAELLRQAGYAGEPIVFEATDGYLDNDAAMTMVIAAMWQQVGINVEVRWITRAERTEKNLARGFAGVWWSDPTSTIQDPDGMMFRLIAPGGFQDYWHDDEWLRLGTEARTSLDPAAPTIGTTARCRRSCSTSYPGFRSCSRRRGTASRNEVTWQPSPTGRVELRQECFAGPTSAGSWRPGDEPGRRTRDNGRDAQESETFKGIPSVLVLGGLGRQRVEGHPQHRGLGLVPPLVVHAAGDQHAVAFGDGVALAAADQRARAFQDVDGVLPLVGVPAVLGVADGAGRHRRRCRA